MARKHYYYCFFVISTEEQLVYVGISYAEDKLAILRKHLRGEVEETKYFFEYEAHQKTAWIHVRKAEYRYKEDAIEEARGWEQYFSAQKYQVLSRQKGEAYDGSGDILTNAYRQAVNDVLRSPGTMNYQCESCVGQKKTANQKYTAERAGVTLTLRTTPVVAEAFRAICRKHGVTQSQALGMLIDTSEGNTVLTEYDMEGRLQRADDMIFELEADMSDYVINAEYRIRTLERRIKLLQRMTSGCVKYWPYDYTSSYDSVAVYSRKRAKRYWRERREYSYPESDGVTMLQIDALCYGRSNKHRGQSVFLYGVEVESQKKIKLRCYYRKGFTGKFPTITEFRRKSLLWEVAYTQALDGAVDLIGAIPLEKAWLSKAAKKEKRLFDEDEECVISEWLDRQNEFNEDVCVNDATGVDITSFAVLIKDAEKRSAEQRYKK